MAITVVGTTWGSAGVGGGAPNWTVNIPTGTQSGDVMLLGVFGGNPASISGWTKAGGDSAGSARWAAFYRVASASESAVALENHQMSIITLRGPDAPVAVTGNFAEDTVDASTAKLDVPGVSHAVSAGEAFCFAAQGSAVTWQATPAGWTLESNGLTEGNVRLAWFRRANPPSPTGTFTIGANTGGASTAAWGQQFVMAEAGGLTMVV